MSSAFISTAVPGGSFYSAHFAFIGDNEDFAVRHNTFGLGAGARFRLDISPKYSVVNQPKLAPAVSLGLSSRL